MIHVHRERINRRMTQIIGNSNMKMQNTQTMAKKVLLHKCTREMQKGESCWKLMLDNQIREKLE